MSPPQIKRRSEPFSLGAPAAKRERRGPAIGGALDFSSLRAPSLFGASSPVSAGPSAGTPSCSPAHAGAGLTADAGFAPQRLARPGCGAASSGSVAVQNPFFSTVFPGFAGLAVRRQLPRPARAGLASRVLDLGPVSASTASAGRSLPLFSAPAPEIPAPMPQHNMRIRPMTDAVELGGGHFGKVYSALLEGKPAVVKVFQGRAHLSSVQQEFERQRIAAVVGAAPAPLHDGPFYVSGSDIEYQRDVITLQQFAEDELQDSSDEERQKIITDYIQKAIRNKSISSENIAPHHILVEYDRDKKKVHGVYLNCRPAFAMMAINRAKSLSDFVKDNLAAYPAERRAAIIQTIVDKALASLIRMHSTGLAHNDIAPVNILVVVNDANDVEDVLFIDFGVSDDDEGHAQYHTQETLSFRNRTIRDSISLANVLLELAGLYNPAEHPSGSKLRLSQVIALIEGSPFSASSKQQMTDLISQKDLAPTKSRAQFEAAHPERTGRLVSYAQFAADHHLFNSPGNGSCLWYTLAYAAIGMGFVIPQTLDPLAAQIHQAAVAYITENHTLANGDISFEELGLDPNFTDFNTFATMPMLTAALSWFAPHGITAIHVHLYDDMGHETIQIIGNEAAAGPHVLHVHLYAQHYFAPLHVPAHPLLDGPAEHAVAAAAAVFPTAPLVDSTVASLPFSTQVSAPPPSSASAATAVGEALVGTFLGHLMTPSSFFGPAR